MEIRHEDRGPRGAFLATVDGTQRGELTYTKAGEGRIIIDHTEVDGSLAGQGVGRQLVEAAVAHARTNRIAVLVTCPFAKSVFERHPELTDVLDG